MIKPAASKRALVFEKESMNFGNRRELGMSIMHMINPTARVKCLVHRIAR